MAEVHIVSSEADVPRERDGDGDADKEVDLEARRSRLGIWVWKALDLSEVNWRRCEEAV